MINKKYANFETTLEFQNTKLSMSPDNKTYGYYGSTKVYPGEPDLPWTCIVFCREAQVIFTHGGYYDCSEEDPETNNFVCYIGETTEPPTLDSEPSKDWEPSEYNDHAGSYYVTLDSYVYYFGESNSGEWGWFPVQDNLLYKMRDDIEDIRNQGLDPRLYFLKTSGEKLTEDLELSKQTIETLQSQISDILNVIGEEGSLKEIYATKDDLQKTKDDLKEIKKTIGDGGVISETYATKEEISVFAQATDVSRNALEISGLKDRVEDVENETSDFLHQTSSNYKQIQDLQEKVNNLEIESTFLPDSYVSRDEYEKGSFCCFVSETSTPPTLNTLPSLNWATRDYPDHAGDFLITLDGIIYTFQQSYTGDWEWKCISDVFLLKLQEELEELKNRVKTLEDELYKKP